MTNAIRNNHAIAASKVAGTDVYNLSGEHIGHVEDVILDKKSNNILFAVLGFGGFLGIGQKYHPMPWSMLNYDENKSGYVVSVSRDILERAPAHDMSELISNDASISRKATEYYAPHH
ncbi:MAG: PRC-barrel domain-containing protein [Proteobacteria bacterium]|nr:PRC-barrel domain-containing protein [Pseudomonadota bacterium]